ncbi:hypothetical protein [Rhinopithecimicrobium faecis]
MTGFLKKSANDPILSVFGISLYLNLFQYWNLNRFRNPILVLRKDLMDLSKIRSTATYHRCLNLLIEHEYISYKPSHIPTILSEIYLHDLSDFQGPNPFGMLGDFKQVDQRSKTIRSTARRAANVRTEANATIIHDAESLNELPPLQSEIFKVNQSESFLATQATDQVDKPMDKLLGKPILESANELAGKHLLDKRKQTHEQDKNKTKVNEGALSSAENLLVKENIGNEGFDRAIPPSLDLVKRFFQGNHSTALEAEKFVHHYTSNGWKVGGKTPMINWCSSAHSWILKIDNFKSKRHEKDRAKHLRVTTNKRYDDPY